MPQSVISAVNYSEVLKKAVERGKELDQVASAIQKLSLPIIPFEEKLAHASAQLYPVSKQHGLSFADRACLALGMQLGGEVMTAERTWPKLGLSIKVKLIRNAH